MNKSLEWGMGTGNPAIPVPCYCSPKDPFLCLPGTPLHLVMLYLVLSLIKLQREKVIFSLHSIST